MKEEFVYSTIIKLPEDNGQKLQKLVDTIDINDDRIRTKNSFHITMESKLHCFDESFRTDLDQLLGYQDPFNVTLNKVDFFIRDRGCILFLTTDNQKEIKRINRLHNEIYKIVRPPELYEEDRHEFIPHVTLFSRVPFEQIGELKNEVEDNYTDYLNFRISQVIVSKREKDKGNWEECYRIDLKDNGLTSSQGGRLILKPRLLLTRQVS